MAERKLPKGVVEKTYIQGFLNDGEVREVDYGYITNHLPETTQKKRVIASSFELALASAARKQ